MYDRPDIGHGNMKILTDEDLQRDENGFTNPNLHRRIDPSQGEGEYAPRDYNLFISRYDSYRLTSSYFGSIDNDEEIP